MATLDQLLNSLAESDEKIGQLAKSLWEEEARRSGIVRELIALIGRTNPPPASQEKASPARPSVSLPAAVVDEPFMDEGDRLRAFVRVLAARVKAPFNARDAAAALNCSERTASKYLVMAVRARLLVVIRNGLYAFPEKPSSPR